MIVPAPFRRLSVTLTVVPLRLMTSQYGLRADPSPISSAGVTTETAAALWCRNTIQAAAVRKRESGLVLVCVIWSALLGNRISCRTVDRLDDGGPRQRGEKGRPMSMTGWDARADVVRGRVAGGNATTRVFHQQKRWPDRDDGTAQRAAPHTSARSTPIRPGARGAALRPRVPRPPPRCSVARAGAPTIAAGAGGRRRGSRRGSPRTSP